MTFVIPAPAVPSVAVADSPDVFPVRRILCVGRNYAEHAREMGNDPREAPFFFAKPGDAVVPASGTVPYPTLTSQLEYEVELVVAIGSTASSVSAETALDHVWGYAVGVDLTRRDRQQEAKDTRRPWDVAKGFDDSAPVTPLVRAGAGTAGAGVAVAVAGTAVAGAGAGAGAGASTIPDSGRIWLSVNGETRQQGDLSDMIWPVADIVAAASRAWVLEPGDLIFTGTPSGVGAVLPGDVISGGVDGLGEFTFTIGALPAS